MVGNIPFQQAVLDFASYDNLNMVVVRFASFILTQGDITLSYYETISSPLFASHIRWCTKDKIIIGP
jgi:hypothetical protein